jgi:hypothetical protein
MIISCFKAKFKEINDDKISNLINDSSWMLDLLWSMSLLISSEKIKWWFSLDF